jgi:hypothetical protein
MARWAVPQVFLEFRLPSYVKLPPGSSLEQAMSFFTVHFLLAHLELPASSSWRRRRAPLNRDMTVPIGTFKAEAICL